MTTFSLADLQAIARRVIGDPSITVAGEGMAADVPGWDSLHHTLIVMEINEALGLDLPANRVARARDFDHLVRMFNAALKRPA